LSRLAAAAVAVLAVVSAAVTLPKSWSFASDERASFTGVAGSPTLVFKYQQLLPAEAVRFVQARLRPRERYYVLPRKGMLFAGVSFPTAVRTFARYALLPAVQVDDPNDADAVVGVGADPGTLALQYSKVEWDPAKSGVVVAEIAP
jgi:hypothetical protein